VLDAVDEELEEGDVEPLPFLSSDEVRVIQVVRNQVRIGRDIEGIVVDDEGAGDVLYEVLLNAPLKEDLLILAQDAEEPGEIGLHLARSKERDDIRVPDRLQAGAIFFVVMDADDAAVMKPGILADLLEDTKAIYVLVRKVEYLDFRQFVFHELDDI